MRFVSEDKLLGEAGTRQKMLSVCSTMAIPIGGNTIAAGLYASE